MQDKIKMILLLGKIQDQFQGYGQINSIGIEKIQRLSKKRERNKSKMLDSYHFFLQLSNAA